jgi:hypothetical protein
VISLEGFCLGTGGTQYYIQLLGTANPTSTTTVPLYSLQVVGQNGFSFLYDKQTLQTQNLNTAGGSTTTAGSNTLPVYAFLSTTDTVYTAPADGAKADLFATVEQGSVDEPNSTVTGDLTTGVDSLAVYASDPTKRLIQFTAKNNGGADAYLMLFGLVPTAGWTPNQQWLVKAGATLTARFGYQGSSIIQGNPTTLVLSYGAYLYGSSTTQLLTATAATQWNLKAWNI